jgi:DDE family transposase
MGAADASSLLSFLAAVPDPRSRHGRRHPLSALLAAVCGAVLCGARSYAAIAQWAADQDIALMHRLGFTRRPPKLGGIRKVLIALDIAAFEAALTRWAEAMLGRPVVADPSPPEAWALDGKSARGSFDGLEKAVHLLSLVAHESGLTLTQAAVPNGGHDKTNEHKAALRLLEGLVLRGRLITGDAMFCQRDFCRRVLDAGGHYLVFVKENQPTLLHDIEAAFAPAATGAFSPSAAADLG